MAQTTPGPRALALRADLVWAGVVLAAFLITTGSLHSLDRQGLHYWYLYATPLAIAGLRFGLRGALIASAITALALVAIYLRAAQVAVAAQYGLLDDLARFLPAEANALVLHQLRQAGGLDLGTILGSVGAGYLVLVLLAFLVGALSDKKAPAPDLERTTQQLRRYFSPRVVDTILTRAEGLPPARKEVTVLFADLRGSTSFFERLDPEEMNRLLNEYLEEMTDVVFKHRGTLDKYIGDAVMAVFGDPEYFPDHPESALRAALEMRQRFQSVRSNWQERGLEAVNIGIGVNTGFVTAGNIGSPNRLEYTVVGTNVSAAANLCGRAAPGQILTTSRTFSTVSHLFVGRRLEDFTPKGIKYPIEVIEVTGARLSPGAADAGEAGSPFDEALRLISQDPTFRALMVVRPEEALKNLSLDREKIELLKLLAALTGHRLFEDVPPAELELLMHSAEVERFAAGTNIVNQDDKTKSFHVLASGEVAVLMRDTEDHLSHVATLGKGAYFGEMAMLFDTPRVATVRALGEVEALTFREATFRELLERAPRLAANIREEARHRLAA